MIPPLQTAWKVFEWRVTVGRWWQASNESPFAQRQVFGRLAKIELCCSLDAIGIMPIENLIQIHFKDLVFAIALFNTPRQKSFTYLASEGPVTREKERAGHLLSNGARPLPSPACLEMDPHRTQDPPRVYSVVRVKAPVFCRDCGLAYVQGDIFQRHENAFFDEKVGNQFSVPVIDFGHQAGLIMFEFGYLRQICGQALVDHKTSSDGGQQDEHKQRTKHE